MDPAISPVEIGDEKEGRKEDESEEEEETEMEVEIHGEEVVERIRASREERVVKKMIDPRRPTEREVEEHNLTHLPYRNWCPVCVRAKGKDSDHRKSIDEERGLAEFSFDYCFPGDDLDHRITILVGRERSTGMTMASTLPSKGSKGKFAADKVIEYFWDCGNGNGDIILKTDQEPAIKCLVKDLVLERGDEPGCRTMVEESPVASKGSNGLAEKAVQEIEGQVRALKLALEGRIGQKIDAESRVVAFMAEYAAYLVNRLSVGKDGKTPYERNKGKKATVLGVEFGEKLLYKRKAQSKADKINPRWEYGIFVGVRAKSGELWIANRDGIVKARSARRIPVQARWSVDSVSWVKFVPWHLYKDHAGADGDIPEDQVVDPVPIESAPEGRVPPSVVCTRKVPPRAFQIRKSDAEIHGYTRGCPGCTSWFRGLGRQAHTPECRDRFANLLKDDVRFQKAEAKRVEFEEKAVRRDEKRRRRTEEGEGGAQVEVPVPAQVEVPASVGGDPVGSGASGSAPDMTMSEAAKRASAASADLEDGWMQYAEELKAKRAKRGEHEDKDVDILELGVDLADFDEATNEDEGLEVADLAEDINPELLGAAREEELDFMKTIDMWEKSSYEECYLRTGRGPVSTRWVDVDKGRKGDSDVRSRLVARDFKVRGDGRELEVYASMPPLEAKRLIFRMAMANGCVGGNAHRGRVKLMFVDVRKAHLNGKLREDEFAYIQLPSEAGGGVARLKRWLYGMRPAAKAWEADYSQKLKEAGFLKGKGSPSVYFNPASGVRLVVWGDDFSFLGREKDLSDMLDKMRSWYSIKLRGIVGPDPGDLKEIRILNRQLRWTTDGIEYEADDKHVQTIIKGVGLEEDSNGTDVALPCEYEAEEGDLELSVQQAKVYRSLAATVNFLASDRPDIQFAAGVLGRTMARPSTRSWANLKKVGRYLQAHPRVVYKYFPCELDEARVLMSFGDSDWAGCKTTRKSVSGGAISLAGGLIKSWSNRQATRALSSGEAEFYASSKAGIETLGIESLMMDMGWPIVSKKILTDSDACRGMTARRGLGKVKHLDLRRLWLQEAVETRGLELGRVEGVANPSDPMTKLIPYPSAMLVFEVLNLV